MCSISGQTRSAEWVLLSKLWENLIFPRPNKLSWGGWKYLNQLTIELIFPHEPQIFQDLHDLDRLRNHQDLQKIEDPPDILGVPDLCDLQYPQDIQALQGFQDFVTFMTLSSFVTLQISMAFQGKIWTFMTPTPPPPLNYDLVVKKLGFFDAFPEKSHLHTNSIYFLI